MPRNVIVITNATVELGPTAAATVFTCQVSQAALTPTANTVDVPATFCAPASQAAAASSWALDLVLLQDWGDVASASMFLFDNDAQVVDFKVDGIGISGSPMQATGQCTVVAGAFGGEAGIPLEATVSLPILGKPVIAAGTLVTAAAEADTDQAATYQPA